MAETMKVLGQVAPLATTLTPIYTVPAATQATVSSLIVCNRGAVQQKFRVSVAIGGAANDAKQYIYYDLAIDANDTFIATVGLTLGAADVVRGYASSADLSFSLYGVEVA